MGKFIDRVADLSFPWNRLAIIPNSSDLIIFGGIEDVVLWIPELVEWVTERAR